MDAQNDKQADLKRRIRNNALMLGAVALLFFLGFIGISALR